MAGCKRLQRHGRPAFVCEAPVNCRGGGHGRSFRPPGFALESLPRLRQLSPHLQHVAEQTWHQSVLGNLRLADKWRPRPA